MTGDIKWIEVWADYADPGGYLLTLRALADGTFEIKDPQKGGAVIATFKSHEEALHWLGEDEYDPVGRLECELPAKEPASLAPDTLTR